MEWKLEYIEAFSQARKLLQQEAQRSKSDPRKELPNFDDPVASARAWADEREQKMIEAKGRQKAEALVEVLEPKARAHDRYAGTDGLVNLTTAAKELQIPPHKFVERLRSLRWIYRRAGGKNNLAYQDKIVAGYLTHKTKIITTEAGEEKACDQVMVTPKGLVRLADVFEAKLLPNSSRQHDIFEEPNNG